MRILIALYNFIRRKTGNMPSKKYDSMGKWLEKGYEYYEAHKKDSI